MLIFRRLRCSSAVHCLAPLTIQAAFCLKVSICLTDCVIWYVSYRKGCKCQRIWRFEARPFSVFVRLSSGLLQVLAYMGEKSLWFLITRQIGFYSAFLGSKVSLFGFFIFLQKMPPCFSLYSNIEGQLQLPRGEDMLLNLQQFPLKDKLYLFSHIKGTLIIYLMTQDNLDILLKMKPISSLLTLLCLVLSTQAAYSPAIAREMAFMSAIAYESAVSIQAWNCKLCQEYKVALPKVFLNLTSGVRGFTGYSSSLNSVIVSFKGADSINTFINQLKIAKETYDKCPNCEVSRNFNELYLTVASSVLSQIQSLHRIYRNSGIYITGHGLGGAFAILAATDIKSLYQSADAVYTFGQPRVGNDQFAAYYSKNLPQTYRIINNADIVPHLPALSAGYQHSSFEQWYQNGMTTYKTCEGESASCSNSIPPQSWSINDNSINAYITLASISANPQLSRHV